MKKKDFVLAVMGLFPDQTFTPVQVQKLFFLVDEKLPAYSDCPKGVPYFQFEPYDYGPFDRSVYDVLDSLRQEGFVDLIGNHWNPRRAYEVTNDGIKKGKLLVKQIPEAPRAYIKALGNWVFSVTFAQLISTIYQAFPEMKVNSVFKE